MSPTELVETADKAGVKALVLTDINNTSAAFQFINACKQKKIKPILGIEFRSNAKGEAHTNCQDAKLRYIGIAKNREGFRELCSLLSTSSLNKTPLPEVAPNFKNAIVIYRKLIKPIEEFKSHEYLGIRPEEVNRLFSSNLKERQDRLVAFCPVNHQNESYHRIHRILRCIDLNILIGDLEPKHCAKAKDKFHTLESIKTAYQLYPKIIQNTQTILDYCELEMPSSPSNNKNTYTGSAQEDYQLLCRLAVEGCHKRYGTHNKKALKRTLKELKVIEDFGYSSYFLMTWDIIRFARSRSYHHVGRGSGANSIVAYNLLITDVDPLELDLYFERFINPHRSSPPDFDIDFSWDERDEVIDYIFKRHGREHTALLATYNTFKGKSIVREMGKVLGLSKADIDLIVNRPHAKKRHHPFAKHIFKYGKLIIGFPNYLSIHAGGIIISQEPLNYFSALQLMPKGFPITHFDMYAAEALQFHKYDVLSQRGLGHIKDAVQIINQNCGKTIDIRDVSKIKKDPQVKKQLLSGQCIGCFYIESPAMRGLLKKLRCDNYVHLVAASSIIRPGVAQSGMMREYINRYQNPKSYQFLHPVFEEYLSETYGIMVYQEDVMKIVHHFSGLGLDESDVLRRIMTGKKKSSETFRRLQDKYFTNCKKRGHDDELAKEVWRQIASFSGYSFCKAHSASFAIESLQSLYLKAHYPLEFMVAVINNFGGFYSSEFYIHEARMLGGKILAPCINHSGFLTNISGKDIYIGFTHISTFEKKLAERIVQERRLNGYFKDLRDFVQRIDIVQNQLETLVSLGAFRFTGQNKYELMWEKNTVHKPQKKLHYTGRMFDDEDQNYQLPAIDEAPHEQAFDEIELLGFPLCSPFDLLKTKYRGDVQANNMLSRLGKRVNMVGYFVTLKNVTTVNKKLMNFGTWLDCEGKYFDTIHFPPSLASFPFKGKGCYIMQGIIVEDIGFPSMEVKKMDILPYIQDPRY